jgi:hypothetical protein
VRLRIFDVALACDQQPFADRPDEISEQGALGTAGLSPGVPSSVEPSGTALLVDPGVELTPDVAALGEPDAPEVQPVAVDVIPPPSKLELAPTVVEVPEQLSPLESSSVAPSGIPPGIDGWLESDELSGDVVPIPGVALTCAKPTSQCAKSNKVAPAVVRTRHIEASVFFVAASLGLAAISPIDQRFSTHLRRANVQLR